MSSDVRQHGNSALDELAQDPDAARAHAGRLVDSRLQAQYDAAVALIKDLRELAEREGQAEAFDGAAPRAFP